MLCLYFLFFKDPCFANDIFLLPKDLPLTKKTSCKISLLIMNSLSVFLSDRSLFLLFRWKDNFDGYIILGWWFFFQHIKDLSPLCSCLHVFWWEICFHFYLCSSIGKLFSCFLQKFNFVLRFWLHICMYLYFIYFLFLVDILLGILWASWICYLVSVISFGKFSAIITSGNLYLSFLLSGISMHIF